ncbi:helix-turn-helix domain-containing protein [Cupriavidus necator H16]|nr:helix-turn-helix domain-containing protein [Cupriavidus necator H16]
MDRCALLSPEELAELLGKSRNAIYHMLRRDEDSFPQPVLRQNRCIRWRAGDVRDWIDSLSSAKPREIETARRRGRPRQGDLQRSPSDSAPLANDHSTALGQARARKLVRFTLG